MGGGGNNAVQSSTTTSEPWSKMQDPLMSLLGQAKTLYTQPYQQYQGQMIADPSDTTVAAYNAAYQRGSLGAPDLNAARGMAADTASGMYLNTNPYLSSQYADNAINYNANQMANAFATGTAANNDAMAARSGVFGGSAHQQKQTADAAAMAGQVGNMANQYKLQNAQMGAADYQAGMGNMLQAGALAGNLSQDDYKSIDLLRSVGAEQQGLEQKYIDNAYKQWTDSMNAPYSGLNNLAQLYFQASGMGNTGSQTMYGAGNSALGMGLGAGLLGLGAYNAMKTP